MRKSIGHELRWMQILESIVSQKSKVCAGSVGLQGASSKDDRWTMKVADRLGFIAFAFAPTNPTKASLEEGEEEATQILRAAAAPASGKEREAKDKLTVLVLI